MNSEPRIQRATSTPFEDTRRHWRLMSAYERLEQLVVLALSFIIAVVIVIALLAMSRKFVILDITATPPGVIAALAAVTVALGVVYWLLRTSDSWLQGDRRE